MLEYFFLSFETRFRGCKWKMECYKMQLNTYSDKKMGVVFTCKHIFYAEKIKQNFSNNYKETLSNIKLNMTFFKL